VIQRIPQANLVLTASAVGLIPFVVFQVRDGFNDIVLSKSSHRRSLPGVARPIPPRCCIRG
jgi:hypothetical protein